MMRILTMTESKHEALDQSHKKRTEVCAIYVNDTEDRFADSVH